jgi:hypothetical protein
MPKLALAYQRSGTGKPATWPERKLDAWPEEILARWLDHQPLTNTYLHATVLA